MTGRRAASDVSRGACRSSTMIVMMMAITPSLKASSRPLLMFGFEPPQSRASYQAALDWNTGGYAGVASIRELEASRYLYLPETSGRERMARRACSVLAAVQLRGTTVADNYSEQKSTLVIRVPLSEESYASIYFSNHEGRPMNAREWWHLKQVVELASHAFSTPEDKPKRATQGMGAGGGVRRRGV